MKTKIIQVYNDYYPPILGGIEKHINDICEGLRDDFDISVLVCSRRIFGFKEYINGIPVRRTAEFGRLQSAPLAPFMPYWMKKEKADIIHLHLPCPTAVMSYLFTKPKGRLIVTYHSDIVRQQWAMSIYQKYLYKVLNQAEKIIVSSENYLNTSPHLRNFRQKCFIMPMGIEVKRFQAVEGDSLHPRPYILFVGKLRYYKGLQYLIQAVKDIDIDLLIIGTGKEKGELIKQTEELGLEKKVKFLGDVQDKLLPIYYKHAKCFVLPSIYRSEAFGIVLLEAMAAGTPLITTKIGTATDWINQDGETGIVVSPEDSEALKKAINKILNNKQLHQTMSQNAYTRTTQTFPIQKNLDLLNKIYKINNKLHILRWT